MDKPIYAIRTRRFRPIGWTLVILLVAAVGATLMSSLPHADREFAFITAKHPIDVMNDHNGQWFYYMPEFAPQGGVAPLAATVRREVLPLGFTEDLTQRPWYRFVKGKREIIVCYHDEIAANSSPLGGTIFHEKRVRVKGQPRSLYPVLWVHQPGSNPVGSAIFQVEKFAFRW